MTYIGDIRNKIINPLNKFYKVYGKIAPKKDYPKIDSIIIHINKIPK